MTSEHFDPSEQETKELLPKNESDMSDYTEDTNADPEGAEKRSARADIQLPDYWYKKYALDDFGKPTFNKNVVNADSSSHMIFNFSVSPADLSNKAFLTAVSPNVLAVSAKDIPYLRWLSGKSRITQKCSACPSS